MFGKKRLVLIIASVLLLSLVMMLNASAADGADLRVSILKYDPIPAEIGEYVSVWVKVENLGYAKADDLSIRMVPDYPFSMDSSANAQVNIGILTPDNAAVEEFRLFTDTAAKQGTGTFEVWYQEDSSGTWFKKEFEIRVGSDSFDSKGTIQLSGEPVKEPEVFMPGDTGTISFTLQNSATDYSITIDGEQYDTNARIQSASLSGVEGVKVTTGTYYGNGIIGPGESVDLTYNVQVDEDTPDGTYYLEFSIVGSSHSYNNNWRIPIKVDSSSVRVIPSKPLALENGEGVLEFDVANIHPNMLSSVSVQLEAEGIEFSPAEYFIGSMDPDELFTIEINAKAASEDITFPVDLIINADFRNGLNEHTQQVEVRQLKHHVVESDSGSGIYLLVLLLIVVGAGAYILYKRRMEKQ
ncbi:COG1361 S-layer family protein [Methanolobus mangrovi]|uniref:COG1361 S-layer family protein n=1 Tax=Methanolobus mangrovi TaxID=3072977 RepID=A0AA51UE69_9EURY|nr:COG1361 S-layer family protein [Methanolobus mangrovi]WMW21324.1 COG1361 S-layer family protein [Methanolobus mangrovi]